MAQAVNSTALLEFVRNVSADEAQASETRLNWFRSFVVPMTGPEVKELFKQASARSREEAGLKPEDKQRTTEEIRLSELRQLYGAEKFGNLDTTSKGWHASIEAARKTLKELSINWQGEKKATPDQRVTQAHARLESALFEEVTQQHPDMPRDERLKLVDELFAEREEQVAMEKAQKVADGLMKNVENARLVLKALTEAIHIYDATLSAIDAGTAMPNVKAA